MFLEVIFDAYLSVLGVSLETATRRVFLEKKPLGRFEITMVTSDLVSNINITDSALVGLLVYLTKSRLKSITYASRYKIDFIPRFHLLKITDKILPLKVV
jgi:hypothetical protein